MIQPGARVFDRDGLEGTVDSLTGTEEDGRRRVVLSFPQGQRIRIPLELIAAQADGSHRLPFSLGALPRGEDVTTSPSGTSGPSAAEQTWVFPVIKEELSIERRLIDVAGVRVTKSVREEERVVDEAVWRDEVGVEMVEVNRIVDGPVAARSEGDTVIVPLLEEVLVVEKRLLLREELRLTKRRVQVRARQNVTLRSEEISVSRVPLGQGTPGEEVSSEKPPEKVSTT